MAILRTFAAFTLLVTMARVLGRKALSQMTFYDFTVVLTFGSVAANIGIGQNATFISSVAVLITVGILGLFSSLLHIKSFRFRKLINSEPLIIIENGEIIEANMRKVRVNIGELNSMLRFQGYFNITDVHYAIMENSGTLSVLPKAQSRPLTPRDMQLNPTESGLMKEVIINGRIMHENLDSTQLTEEWLLNELRLNGIQDVKDVFFAGLESSGKLYLSKRKYYDVEQHGEHGIE